MNNALDKIKKAVSAEKSSWLDEATERQKNRGWLRYSFQIAARILIEIRKQNSVNGMTQKLLAEKMGVTPQYINKVLKGKENLTLETITKFEENLGISLLTVNKYQDTNDPEIVSEKSFNSDSIIKSFSLKSIAFDKDITNFLHVTSHANLKIDQNQSSYKSKKNFILFFPEVNEPHWIIYPVKERFKNLKYKNEG